MVPRGSGLAEVLGTEHALGAAQDGVLGGVVGVLLGGDLQDRRDGAHVAVDGVADQLGDELVDQDDADVTAAQEAPEDRRTGSEDRQAGSEDRQEAPEDREEVRTDRK